MRYFLLLIAFCISAPALADSGVKPLLGEKFISLSAQRNLAGNRKPQIASPARFMPLANKNKFIPIGRRAQALSAPVLPADEQPTRPATAALQKKAASAMTAEQAQQILSIFAVND
jgi:hypothetical protein